MRRYLTTRRGPGREDSGELGELARWKKGRRRFPTKKAMAG